MNFLQFFKNFYSRNAIEVDSISQREFGIGIDKKINYRHKAFSNPLELRHFLVNETPRFISHSVGKFEFPWCQPMERKNLLGADLIFDIDAKPEENHNPVFCSQCVETSRVDVVRLIENFLIPIFGFSQSELLIVFSGSKGFHVHVHSQLVQQLSSTSRRLLVDFITGREISVDSLVRRQRPNQETRATHLTGPGKNSTGWKKRFFNAALKALDNPSLFSRKKAAFIAANKAMLVNLLENGNWDPVFHDSPSALEGMLADMVRENAVQVDSPVTFDVHRLIRVPGTLHGDTGLIAKSLSIAELGVFEPTRGAVAFKGSHQITLNESASLNFAGEEIALKPGENEVPLALAVLLSCRGILV